MRRLLCLLTLLALACDRPEKEWQTATQANSVAGYERFLSRHPKSAQAAEAEKRIADLQRRAEIDSALIAGTAAALERVAAKHPDDPSMAKVRERLDQLYFRGAESEGTFQAWEAYLAAHGSSPPAAQARARLQELLDARQPAFRAVKTVRLDIKEDYGEASKTTLPFRDEVASVLTRAGVQVVDAKDADAVITVRASGEPLSGSYTSFSGGGARELYTGADFDGSITIAAGASKISESFSHHIGTPFSFSHLSMAGPANADDAPFEKAFSRCVPDAVRRLVVRAFGAPPLFAEITATSARNPVAAARALGRMSPPPVDRLMAVMVSGPQPLHRNAAAEGLAKAGAPAVPPLLEALHHASGDVRLAAVNALGMIGDTRAVAPLIEQLAGTNDDVRCRVVAALGKFDKPAALAAIVERASDASNHLRTCAAAALGAPVSDSDDDEVIDDDSGARSLLNDTRNMDTIRGLMKAAVINNGEARTHVIEALMKSNLDVTIPLLVTALNGEDRAASLAAVDALGRSYGDERATFPLIAKFRKSFAASDFELARLIAEALGGINDDRAVKPLLEALSTPNEQLRAAVVNALGTIGDERAVAPLKALKAGGKSAAEVEVALSNIQSRNGE